MIVRNHLFRLLAILVIAGCLGACRKEKPAQWDIDVLGPLIKTSFTISDLLADSLMTTDENGAITLLYSDELFALRLDTILQRPDTSFFYNYVLPVPGPLNFPAGITPLDQNDVTRFDLGDVQLRTLIIREGFLDLELKNMIASGIIGTFSLPGTQLQGSPASMVITTGAGTPAQPSVSYGTQDLAGAVFDLRGPQLDDVNTLATHLTAQLDPNGSGATVTDQDSIIATVTYRDLLPQYAKGYFGQRTIEVGPDSTRIDIFERIVDGSLDLDQVTLRMKVENGLGVDIQAFMRQFRASNTRTGASVDLSHTIMQGPINLSRAIESGGSFQPSFYQNELDNSDSNIDLFLETLPDQVSYEIDLEMNPLGDISNGNDFLYYDSRVRAELEVEIPLNIIATNLTLENTLQPDLPGTSEAHSLQSGELKIFATNGFPFSAALQIDIVDDQGNVWSSLPVEGTIASGILGSDLLVQSSVDSRLDTRLTEEQVTMLYNGGKFRIRTIFNTADQTQHIQLLDNYTLDLQITAGAHYLVNGDE
jgi:hypothetical protein